MTGWLIDKSALARLGRSAEPALWADRVERGLVRISTVTRLEIGYSARSAGELHEIVTSPPVSSLLIEYFTPAVEERALEVQRMLARRAQHRAPSLADLLLAATAEVNHLSVLHVDEDFDLIAGVTGQPVERLLLADLPAGQ